MCVCVCVCAGKGSPISATLFEEGYSPTISLYYFTSTPCLERRAFACVRERERERECVYVCVFSCLPIEHTTGICGTFFCSFSGIVWTCYGVSVILRARWTGRLSSMHNGDDIEHLWLVQVTNMVCCR